MATHHTGTRLSVRALNRARLDRQWLLQPRDASPMEAMEYLVGLQAQAGDAPYYQLWSRLTHFSLDDLSRLLTSRRAVRVVLMRGTIHMVSARDCARLRPIVQPFLDRVTFNGSSAGKRLVGLDSAELVSCGLDLLAGGPLHVDELGERLAERFSSFAGPDLAYALRCATPLIQVPPRGVWGKGGGLVYASAQQWLPAPEDPQPTLEETILRYLAAFGPASVQDFQTWSSLTRTGEAFQRLRSRLVSYSDESGQELFDLVDTPLPDPDTPVRTKLLGAFDNILLSHADRRHIISKPDQKRLFTHNGLVRGPVLIDGFVAGLWKPAMKAKTATVRFEAFCGWSSADRELLEAEALRLLDFAGGTAAKRIVEFA